MEESLASALSEIAANRLSFAVNRLYYGAFYAATTMLCLRDMSFARHAAPRGAFHRELVHTGLVDRSFGRLYDELFEARHEADHAPATEFNDEVVSVWARDVRRFLDAVGPEVTGGDRD